MDIFTVAEIERFWSHVDKTPGQGPKGKCWLWTSVKNKWGYGMFFVTRNGKRKGFRAHRVSMTITHGEIPDGIFSLHHCDTPACTNPYDCLFLGTQQDNLDDAVSKGRMASGEMHGLNKHPERRSRGESHVDAKVTNGDIAEMRLLDAEGWMGTQIAKKFNLSKAQVSRILNGVRRADVFTKPDEKIDRNQRRYSLHPEATPRGELSGQSKLTDEQVLEIHALGKLGRSQYSISAQFNISRLQIRRILRGERRRELYLKANKLS